MKKSNLNKILVILGPTASGKSDLAIKLAKKFNGEIISADSRQIYRGMDIGSGKVSRDLSGTISNDQFPISKHKEIFISEGIMHYLIDIANPNDDFNVSHFKKLAEKAIKEILQKGKLPIICGGTGFWIKSIVDNVSYPEVKPDKELRERLSRKSAAELFAELRKIDPERAANIDSKNKVRLIRALEICKALGTVPDIRNRKYEIRNTKYEFLQIGIDIPKEKLQENIKKRLEKRLAEGMIKEVQNLNNPPAGGGVSWERLEYFGLEYRWVARYLQKKISLNEVREKLYFDIIHYAKRQMTWFKKDKRILWLKGYEEIEKTVKTFIKD